jgi:large subunit ribosomal protein L7/L12
MAFALRTARTVAARAAPRRAARCARSFCAPAASPKVQQLCDDVCQLNVLELNEFLQLFKEKAGLSDADLQGGGGGGGVMMAPAAAAGGDAAAPAEAVEEKEYFDIKLTGFDAKAKIKVIKEVRALTGLGLKEAKEAVEGAPSVLKKEVKKEEAEEILKKLVELGATAELE